MTLLDRKSNEAWNQYVQSCLTRGMLGNGVSGALWSCFNHRDLGLSTRKHAGYCQNTATPPEMCVWLCMCICDYFLHNWSKLRVHMSAPAWNKSGAFAHLCVNLVGGGPCDLILSVWSWLRCKDHSDLLFLLPSNLFLRPHSSSVSLAFTATTEPNADPACEVRALPANHLAGSPPPSPPQSPTTICMLNRTWASNPAQACIYLHADELVSNILNANIAVAKGLMCILNANNILNWNSYR